MSLATQVAALATRVATEFKTVRAEIAAGDVWTDEKLAAIYTNATLTGTDVFAGFTPAANTRYVVDALLSVQSAAATTGIQLALAGPTTGITRAAVKIVTATTASADMVTHTGLNTPQVATAGLTTPNLALVQAVIEVGTPGTGKIRVQARAEVAGTNAVQVLPGSSMRWRTI